MQIHLHYAKVLTEHSAKQLTALSKQTLGPCSGMRLEIQDVRNGYTNENRTVTIYQFRNGSNRNVCWLAHVHSLTRDEIWTFVVPAHRRKGLASQMFKIFERMLTPEQRGFKFLTHGYHDIAADKFYKKMKQQCSFEQVPLNSYFS